MKRLILFLALLLLCGCAAGESAAPVPEGEFYLRFEMSYHEDSKFILDSTGSVTRGTESAQAEFDEEFISKLQALVEKYPVENKSTNFTSGSLKKADEPTFNVDPLAKYKITIGDYTLKGDATAWNYVDRSEDTANFCALCDELMELLHTVPEFIALPAPPPVL